MSEYPVAKTVERSVTDQAVSASYRVLFDGQCEICQACVSWLKALDRGKKTVCLSINEEILPVVNSRLNLDNCLEQLHVVTPENEVLVGWDAVACLARLFPSTWIIGSLGQRFPFRNLARSLYGFVARNRYFLSKYRGGVCVVAKPEAVRRQALFATFGLVTRWAFSFACLLSYGLALRRGCKERAFSSRHITNELTCSTAS